MGTPSANPYAQLFLGFRSLAVKILIFVIMAALLAWALGGTLWPRPQIRAVGEATTTSEGRFVLVVKTGESEEASFALAKVDDDGHLEIVKPMKGLPMWAFALPPVKGENTCALAYQFDGTWRIYVRGSEEHISVKNEFEAVGWLARFSAESAEGSSAPASAGPN